MQSCCGSGATARCTSSSRPHFRYDSNSSCKYVKVGDIKRHHGFPLTACEPIEELPRLQTLKDVYVLPPPVRAGAGN
jgi:hypothetical protein